MSDLSPSWRAELRQYLAARLNTKLTLGALFVEFGEQIPLHHASRIWQNKHKRLGDAERMLWNAMCHELADYPITATSKEKPWRAETVIIPIGRICPFCAGRFFSRKKQHTCSRECGSKLYRLRRAAKACDAHGNTLLWGILDQLEQTYGTAAVRDAISQWWKRHAHPRHRANGYLVEDQRNVPRT